MAYIGTAPAEAYSPTAVKDSFNGDGSTVAFTMSQPSKTNDVRVVVENVIQDPTVAYSCSGTTITFTSAPPVGTANVYVVHLGLPVQSIVPPDEINIATTYTTDLTVQGTVTADGLAIDGDNITANAQDAITIEFSAGSGVISADRTGGNYGLLQLKTTDGSAPKSRQQINYNGDISFYDDTGTDQDLFWDASASSLGIGTTSPDRILHLNNSGTEQNVRAKFSNGTTGEGASDGFEIGINASSPADAVLVNYENSPMAFFTNATERMRIGNAGHLTVNSDGNTSALAGVYGIQVGNSSSPHAGIAFRSSATTGWMWYIPGGSSTDFRLYDSTNNNDKVTFFQDGRKNFTYGKGGTSYNIYANAAATTAFAARFDGVGTGSSNIFQFVNGYGQVGSVTLSGTSTAYNTSSDYRLKENVTGITDGISRVKQLNPVRFNWITDETDTAIDGFIAHEAATVVPEAINGTHDEVYVWLEDEELPEGVSVGDNKLDEDGNTIPKYQGIDQSKLVPLLTAAIKEQQALIEDLQTRLAALENA